MDLDARTLSISKSRTQAGSKGTYVGAPKTANGNRVLPLDDVLLVALRELRKARPTIGGFLVVDPFGLPVAPEDYSRQWVELLDKAQVRYLDLRAARRGSVTAMRNRGVADHVVAAWHGHDEAVMRRHYSVVHDDGMAAAASVLTGVFRTGS
ncbi:MAG: hypothetical protein ACH36H_03200 [Candidatus Nanopelagicales bacterium]